MDWIGSVITSITVCLLWAVCCALFSHLVDAAAVVAAVGAEQKVSEDQAH